jgi:hypothetical protein
MGILQLQQQNVSAPTIYTEYQVAIPPRVNEVTISVRPSGSPANIFWYMTPSGSANPGNVGNLPATYNTIPANASRTIRGQLGGQIIYFQVDQANQVVEVDYYGDT